MHTKWICLVPNKARLNSFTESTMIVKWKYWKAWLVIFDNYFALKQLQHMEKNLFGFRILEKSNVEVKIIIIKVEDGLLFPCFLFTCLSLFSCLYFLTSVCYIYVCMYFFLCMWTSTNFEAPTPSIWTS